MIDTVRLRSPEVQKNISDAFINLCKHRKCIDVSTGNIEWEFFNGTLVGSYDNRVSVKLM